MIAYIMRLKHDDSGLCLFQTNQPVCCLISRIQALNELNATGKISGLHLNEAVIELNIWC